MNSLAPLPTANPKAQPIFGFRSADLNAAFVEVSTPRQRPALPQRTERTDGHVGEREHQGRQTLLKKLLADEGESLDRLSTIVGKAGFKIIFCESKGNDPALSANAAAESALVVGGLTPRSLNRVRGYIESHLADPVGLEALADITGLSRCYFARAFKRSVGMPPHHYLMQRRLECAKKLLADTEMPLAQVALESGFSDQSHFSRRFRQVIGITPRSYRRSER
ncbi:MAG TPA: AraC family transcriptional regulator [Xanthobacteraceae bacterium]|jgi:AraC-like DNA-binding protein|nr:AraC family transcriptional regulator [Xanthobacteraceae bacterium]